jgi:integrase
MSDQASQAARDRDERQKTRHRGISFRETSGGRSYYVYAQGRYVKAGTTEREALALQADLRTRSARGQRVIVPPKITGAELFEQWFEQKTRLAPWTQKSYRDALDLVLLPRFGDWQVAAIDADAVAKLIRGLETDGLHSIDPKRPKRPLSSSTISNYTLPLSGALSLAVRRGVIASNPMRSLTVDERPRQTDRERPHEWSDEEIAELLGAATRLAKRCESRYDYTPLLRTAVFTGLRLGELLGLQWRHVDLDDGLLHVEQQWTRTGALAPPKTKSGIRRVPLSAELVSFLRKLKLASKHSGEADFVFASRAGTPLQHRNVQVRGFEAARDLAGLPSTLTFHDLRHGFASMAAHRGVPVQTLSTALGHRHVGITQSVYLHLYSRESAEDAFRSAMSGSA